MKWPRLKRKLPEWGLLRDRSVWLLLFVLLVGTVGILEIANIGAEADEHCCFWNVPCFLRRYNARRSGAHGRGAASASRS